MHFIVLVKIVIMMGLLMCLSTSSFFLIGHLESKIKRNTFNVQQLKLAEKHQIRAAQYISFAGLKPYSANWFRYAFELGKTDPEIAFELGEYYLSLNQNDQGQRWLILAHKLGFLEATIELANRYEKTGDTTAALELLSSNHNNDTVRVERIKLLLKTENIEAIYQETDLLEDTISSKSFLSELKNFGVLGPKIISNKKCERQIQPIATDWEGLKRIEALTSAFESHALNQYFCIDTPHFVNKSTLGCYHQNDQAIQCSEKSIQQAMKNNAADYLLVIVPKGGANVYQGIAYIDYEDSLEVLAHELSHFLGFVDEYPLPKEHAFCQQKALSSVNVVKLDKLYKGDLVDVRAKVLELLPWKKYISPSTPILIPVNNEKTQWRIGSPTTLPQQSAGLFLADTCRSSEFSTFKPFRHRSALEYFETPFPSLYLNLIESNAKYAMPTFKSFQY